MECQPGPGTDVPGAGLSVGESGEAGATRQNIQKKAGLAARLSPVPLTVWSSSGPGGPADGHFGAIAPKMTISRGFFRAFLPEQKVQQSPSCCEIQLGNVPKNAQASRPPDWLQPPVAS